MVHGETHSNELIQLSKQFNGLTKPVSYDDNRCYNIKRYIEADSLYSKAIELLEDVLHVSGDIPTGILHMVSNSYAQMYVRLSDIINKESIILSEAYQYIPKVLENFNSERKAWYPSIQSWVIERRFKNTEKKQSLAIDEISSLINEYKAEIIQLRKVNEEFKGKLDFIETRYSEVISKLENLYQQDNFYSESLKFKKTANRWLWISIGIVILTLPVIYFSFIWNSVDIDHLDKINNVRQECPDCLQTIIYLSVFKGTLFRLLIVSLFLFALTFAVKNYNAQMHNYAVNLHKSNSLNANGVLMNSASSAQGKEALAINASNAIFLQQPTGYNNKESSALNAVIDKLKFVPKD